LHVAPTFKVRLLLGRSRLTQCLGECSEDTIRRGGTRDVLRSVNHGRNLFRAISRGDVAIDLYHHSSVELRMIGKDGVEPWYVTAMA
jgi:hypothetical protein